MWEPEYIPPVQPQPFKIALGVGLCVLSLWLLFSWLPSKRPMTETEAAAYVADKLAKRDLSVTREWRLRPNIYPYAYVVAAGLGLWGVTGIVRGASHRPRRRARPRPPQW